ncbi:tetratricopeptide repeat protein [Kordia sp. YSTF-M3]|uniref:Tetratricopeptide repeat protein n=1 Tax=Kordia aestuariivivens TaxID=2759037 RepID=A0ABR7QAK9_9FLAO|nr:tetratricopeptide repeat protein [Kordia aestuariivivens]MBC8755607.1 tetratricopeptide repeat protein [Kordia aestuariivivens]
MVIRIQMLALLFLLIPFFVLAESKDSIAAFKEKTLLQQHTYLQERLYTTKEIQDFIAVFSDQAIAKKDTVFIAKSYYFNYRLYRKSKVYSKAHAAIDNAISLAKTSQNDSLLGSFFHAKGATFYIQSNYTDALNYYLKAYDIMRNNSTIDSKLTLEFDIATIKLKANKTSEALQGFKKIIHAYDSLLTLKPDSQFLKIRFIKMLNNTAKSYTDEGMYEEAIALYSKSFSLNETTDYISGRCIAIGGKGNVYTAQKKYDRAIPIIDEALAISTSNNDLKLITPFLLLDKGKCYFGLKRYEEALQSLTEAARIIEKEKLSFMGLDETYQFLAKTYVQLGNHEKATAIYDQYIERNNFSTTKRFELYQTIFEDYDLKNVEHRADKAEETSNLFKSYFTQTIVIAVLLAFSAIVFFVYYRNRQKQKLAKFHKLISALKAKEATTNESQSTGYDYALSDEKASKILDDLAMFETKLSFLDKKYNLTTLAKKCNTNSSYLSQVINTHKGKTFSEYMADLRISYVLNALKNDKKLRSYTIQSIAEEIGFKQSESFSKAFKKRTGFNPSFYIKNLENL